MSRRRIFSAVAISVFLVCTLSVMLCCAFFQAIPEAPHAANATVDTAGDQSYKDVVPVPDFELRQEPLEDRPRDKQVDTSAYIGMPKAYLRVTLQYVEAVTAALKVAPITRGRFYHEPRPNSGRPYPDDANPVYDGEITVPLVLFPRPEVVRKWSESAKARELGWRSEECLAGNRGTAYGRTVIFDAGPRCRNPAVLPAAPYGTGIPSWDSYVTENHPTFFLDLGKIVVSPTYDYGDKKARLLDDTAKLLLGEQDGAKLLGDLVTVPAFLKNHRLRWVSVQNESGLRRFLAYSLLDGNGARREKSEYPLLTSTWHTLYVRPLVCKLYQPKIKQHNELLLPSPLGWAPTAIMHPNFKGDGGVHEEWCLDDWFPAQPEACWVIREAEDSRPLQESFLLMPATEESDRPVFMTALFVETEPTQLVDELAALYNVSPDPVLNSAEEMAHLNGLYEKVRDFPLGK